jgi:hypothetical protein
MIVPLRYWRIHGGIRPWNGKRWSIVIKTRPWGRLGIDWFTDAYDVYDFWLVAIFDHQRPK